MIVSNIRLDIPNGRVVKLAQNVRGKDWMTRKEIREWIEEMVNECIDGKDVRHDGGGEGGVGRDTGVRDTGRSDPVRAFTPSRGDESYLYSPKSVALKDKCSAMLDLAEEVEKMVWEVLEANRQE